MGFTEMIITNAGRELVSKLVAGTDTCEFTKMVTSDHQYTASPDTFTSLDDIKQEAPISAQTKPSATTVKVTSVFTNEAVTTGYYIRALGLYAQDSNDTEILFGVALDDSPSYMPTSTSAASFTFNSVLEVGDSDQIVINVDPGAYALVADLTDTNDRVTVVETMLTGHTGASAVGSDGIHDIRYYNDKLQVYTNDAWTDVQSAGGDLSTHESKLAGSSTGVHGIRNNSNYIQMKIGNSWEALGVDQNGKLTYGTNATLSRRLDQMQSDIYIALSR